MTPHDLPGYVLLERLGEGASGVVHKARQISTGQLVAVKHLRCSEVTEPAASERMRARFERELELCARVHHPHIVRLVDKGRTRRGELFAVFEYVPGETLRDLLVREGALTATRAGELMGQVLDALVAAHAQGIVHRDLKPLNIMVSHSGAQAQAKVLDFGIGTVTGDRARAELRDLTLTSELLGTPRYSAPEQLRGEPPTLQSDLYAWSLIFAECLTGVPAVRGDTLAQIYYAHLSPTEIPLPVGLLRHPLGKLLRRTLNKNPRERAENTEELFTRFRQINFDSIVGVLDEAGQQSATGSYRTTCSSEPLTERRQITMLCYSLDLLSLGQQSIGLEASDELLQDQIAHCDEICRSFGGYPAGALGTGRLMYFGYPQASDVAEGAAADAALELVAQVAQRTTRFEELHGLRLQIRAAIHTCTMVVHSGQLPSGRAVSTARRLEELATPGSPIVSERARNLLDRAFVLDPLGLECSTEDGHPCGVFELRAKRDRLAIGACIDGYEPPEVFGRAGELDLLRAFWKAEAGTSALRLVGEPGIGKSRLARQLCKEVLEGGHQVWILQGSADHRSIALHPFLQWLREELDLRGAGSAAAQRLGMALGSDGAEVAPLLCSWLGLPMAANSLPAPHSPARQRQLVVEGLRALLRRHSPGKRRLVVIEDAHWLDATSRDLVALLVSDASAEGVSLLLTERPDGPPFEKLPAVHLTGLDQSAASALVASMLTGPTLNHGQIQSLVSRADGNPLYLSELTRACTRRLPGHASPITEHGPADEIPASLHGLLGHALDRLGPAKHTAQRAAVWGREFDAALLLRSTGREPDALRRDLEHMTLAGLVAPSGRNATERFTFRHALVRDAAYDSMTELARQQAHERVAAVLETDANPTEPAVLAQHFANAQRFDRAVTYGTKSMRLALSRGLQLDALSQSSAVNVWLAKLPQNTRRLADLDHNLVFTQALMSERGWADPQVREAAEHSARLIDQDDDCERQSAALWALATYHHVAGDRTRVRSLATQLVELSVRSGSASLTRAAFTIQGVAQWIEGHCVAAVESFERVLALPLMQGDDDASQFGLDCRSWSMAALANVHWFIEADAPAALALAQRAVTEAETRNHIPSLGLALMYTAFIHHYADDRTNAASVCKRLLELSRRFGLPAVEGYAAIVDCWARDDLAGASRILQLLEALGCRLGLTYFMSMQAELTARHGDTALAIKIIDECLALSNATGERYYQTELIRKKALLQNTHTGRRPLNELALQ